MPRRPDSGRGSRASRGARAYASRDKAAGAEAPIPESPGHSKRPRRAAVARREADSESRGKRDRDQHLSDAPTNSLRRKVLLKRYEEVTKTAGVSRTRRKKSRKGTQAALPKTQIIIEDAFTKICETVTLQNFSFAATI